MSLDAFRVFETAARHMNFSAAARELLVTQAAVSRRIQKLEDDLGLGLFVREGRRLALTGEGEQLFRRVQGTLDYLADGLDQLMEDRTPEIVALAASGAISHVWLGRMLRDYAIENPAASIRLLTTDAMNDLAAEGNDLSIVYSLGDHPNWNLTLLLAEELVPVASPAYLSHALPGVDPARVSPAQLSGLDLYDYSRVNAYWVTLREWFQQQGAQTADVRPRVVFSNYAMAVDTALRGDGVILGSRQMIHHHLAAGELIELTGRVLTTGYGYYIGLPRNSPVSEEALHLYHWLLARAQSSDLTVQAGS